MRIAIATAANDIYYDSLQHLLRSLNGASRFGDVRLWVLDVGLNAGQRAELEQAGHGVTTPGWDVDIARWKGVPEWFRAMTARPFLPNYVKNADIITWLDADIWVQDIDMLGDYVDIAREGGFAVSLEMDRCYDNMFMRNSSREDYYNNLARYFGQESANRLIHFPMMNCGAFAMPTAHPLWAIWQRTIKDAATQFCNNFMEQTALNMSVYSNNIAPHFLPARYNWMTCHALPLLDESSGLFVEPGKPHDKLGLVHLACGLWKRDDIEYRTRSGKTLRGALRPPSTGVI